VAFVDWTSGYGNLAIRDLREGKNWLVTRNAAPNAWATIPLMAPDGKQIAYQWVDGSDYSIRIIASDGTHMRVLASRREYGDMLGAWSPDGKQIAAIHYNSRGDLTKQIILISVKDGSITPLKTVGWSEPSIGGFSPDGHYLVYSQPGEGGRPSAIFALAVDGRREIPLVQNSSNNWSPAWSSDGSRVVFISDRSGSARLWAIRVQAGRPVGEPEPVHANVDADGIRPLGFTKDGSYHYRAGNLWRDAYTADIDPATLVISRPAPVTDRFVGSNQHPVLSPDGRHVAFFRYTEGPNAGHSLMVRAMANGEERVVRPLTDFIEPWANLVWFPDSRSVLMLARTDDGRRFQFQAIDIESGTVRSLFETPQGIFPIAALSPDGKVLYYTHTDRNASSGGGPGDLKSIRLVKRQLETGVELELHRATSTGIAFFGLTVSRDGSKLAFLANVPERKGYAGGFQAGRSIFVMSAAGGTPREIYHSTVYDLSHHGAMIWNSDGRNLIVSAKCGSQRYQLCAIAEEGGALRPLGVEIQETTSRMMSTDGRRIFFTGATRSPELWVIRKLLPQIASTR
jgi:Tol biopolymer transport system component